MLVKESDAMQRFCPLSRGAQQTAPGSGKFVAGINVGPQSFLTRCVGTNCMLFHVAGSTATEDPKKKCSVCEGEETKVKECKVCNGKGTLHMIEAVGFCGAGADPTISVSLQAVHSDLVILIDSAKKLRQAIK